VPAVLDPLRPLSPVIGLLAELCELAVERVSGHELGERHMALVERLRGSAELPDVLRVGASGIGIHAQAVEDARRGRPRALELAERIAVDLGDDMFLVLHARWLGHAFRGQSALAKRFRRRADVITEDDVWRRRAFLFAEAQLHALTGNLLDLSRTSDAIAELADRFEGWRPWLLWTRAELHRLRGELGSAQAEIGAALALARPGEHRAWAVAAPAHAELLLARGDAAGALREAEAILTAVQERSLDRMAAVAAERVRGLALSSRHDHPAARASIERARALADELGYDGLLLAQLHGAQARIALAGGDAQECGVALARMRALLEHADAPALINAYGALREDAGRLLAITDVPPAMTDDRSLSSEWTQIFTEVRTRLNACGERAARAEQALALLLAECGASAGHLFLFDAGGLFAAASVAEPDVNEELLALAQQYLELELGDARTAAMTVAQSGAAAVTAMPALWASSEARLKPVWLSEGEDSRRRLVGLALLVVRGAPLRKPRSELVRAISRCLQLAGDSVGVPVEH